MQKYKLNANSKYCHNVYFWAVPPLRFEICASIKHFSATGSGSRHSLFCLLPSRTSGNKQKELKQMSPSLTEIQFYFFVKNELQRSDIFLTHGFNRGLKETSL